MAEPLVDLVLRLRTLDDLQPVAARTFRVLGCNDLDPVSVVQNMFDRDKFSVDTRADHAVSHCGVHAVRKVDCAGPGRQLLDIACRRETVNIFRKKIEIGFQKGHEFAVIRHILLPLEDLAEPGELLFLLIPADGMPSGNFLVLPVGRDVECSDWYMFCFGMAI